jgi:hypothetical protein
MVKKNSGGFGSGGLNHNNNNNNNNNRNSNSDGSTASRFYDDPENSSTSDTYYPNNSNSNNNNNNNSNGLGFKMAFGQPVSAPAPQINNRSNQNSFSSSSVRTKEPCCKALYDFEAENSEELDFKEGVLIKLIARLDDNWLLGELNGRQGRFPISYVEVINPLP